MSSKSDKLCDVCEERKGEVHIVQYIGGVRKELFVCYKCAAKVGIDEQLGGESVLLESSLELEHRCPQCGWQLKDIVDTGMLGCPYCYDEFADEVQPLMKHFHGEKCIVRSARPDTAHKLSMLQWRLRKAVDEERFEEAAQIRDLIQQIEIGHFGDE